MGVGPFHYSSSTYDKPKVVYQTVEKIVERPVPVPAPPNPNPFNYQIVNSIEEGGYLVILIQYPDCTNYEGRKILVYKGVNKAHLVLQGSIDPHFSENKEKYSPIARFVPTLEGWQLALELVKSLYKRKHDKTSNHRKNSQYSKTSK